MKIFTIVILLLTIPIFLFSFIGCGNNHNSMITGDTNYSLISKIYPSDGSEGVPTNSIINVAFNDQMDTSTVMNNFFFAGGDEMHEWMDSVTHYGGLGNMNMGNMDHMMAWMDSIHVPGTNHWNHAMDSCEFIPSGEMMPNTEYMIVMDENKMMHNNGNMTGMNMKHDDYGYHLYHFTTGQ